MRLSGALALLVLASTPALADAGAGVAAIDAERVQRAVAHLADDALQGRGSGHDGGRAAGDWLAARLQELGLQPGGDGGTFFQELRQDGLVMRNVVATLPGREPGEAVVIGAHYDHLGLGHQDGSLDFFRGRGRIHNGADDNASGTAAVLEIARAFKASGLTPRRRVVFVFFDGEERGLLGSKHYVERPPFPGERTTLMINLDMVGRLRGKKLTVYGAATGDVLTGWLEQANQVVGLELELRRALAGNSDHHPFYEAGVPVVVPFTGLHLDYHRPSDDAEKVNVDGIVQVARLSFGLAAIAAEAEDPPVYAQVPDGTGLAVLEQLQAMFGDGFGEQAERLRERLGLDEGTGLDELGERLQEFLGGRRARPRLGVTLDPRGDGRPGVRVREVTRGTPAERAGLKAGDRIVRFGPAQVRDVEALRALVRDAKGQVEVEVQRDGAAQALVVDFGAAPPARDPAPRRPRTPEPAPPAPAPGEGRWF